MEDKFLKFLDNEISYLERHMFRCHQAIIEGHDVAYKLLADQQREQQIIRKLRQKYLECLEEVNE